MILVPAKDNGLHPGGRPSYRTPENAMAICNAVADGAMLKEAAQLVGISTASIRDWVRDDPEFATMFARAKEDWADARADENARLVAQEPRMIVNEFGERVDAGWVQHIVSRVNYDKWLISKRSPKVYGDKEQSINVGVGVSIAPQIVLQMPAELLAVRPLEDKGSGRTPDQNEPL